MTKTSSPLYFRPGQFLFHENDPSQCLFLIKTGTVSVRKAREGAYIEIARIYSNEVLGELSFFDRMPRSASAVALTEVEAVQIDFEALDKIYADTPPYFKTIMAAVCERLRRADESIQRLQKKAITYGYDLEEESASSKDITAADALAAADQLQNLPPDTDSDGNPKS